MIHACKNKEKETRRETGTNDQSRLARGVGSSPQRCLVFFRQARHHIYRPPLQDADDLACGHRESFDFTNLSSCHEDLRGMRSPGRMQIQVLHYGFLGMPLRWPVAAQDSHDLACETMNAALKVCAWRCLRMGQMLDPYLLLDPAHSALLCTCRSPRQMTSYSGFNCEVPSLTPACWTECKLTEAGAPGLQVAYCAERNYVPAGAAAIESCNCAHICTKLLPL